MKSFMWKLGTAMEIIGIVGLTGITFKSTMDAHKERQRRYDCEILNSLYKIKDVVQEAQIRTLEEQVNELKSKYEPENEVAEEA